MRTKLLITGFIISLSLNAFAETKKMTQSQLKEATVFFRGAELTHKASVSMQKGDNEVQISGLSPIIDQNSIKIKTTNGVLVSAFEFSVDYLSDKKSKADSSEIKKMQDDILNLRRQAAELETNIKINSEMLSILQKSVIKNVEGSDNGMGIDDLIKTMDYYKKKSLELDGQLLADREKKDGINKDINKLNAQVQQALRVNDKASGILKLNLASSAISNSEITISYYTNAAGWVPYYDINVASTDKPIKFTTKAKVRQTTGLDWDKVKLSLSTSMPSSGKVAPLFHAWFLQYYQPPAIVSGFGGQVKKSRIMIQNSYSYDAVEINEVPIAEDEIAQPTMDNYVIQSENQLNISYNIDIPYSVPDNGKELNIELKNQETSADFKYYSAPRLDAETYVLAEIPNWQKLNLLSAKANVSYDGTYVGETYIDAASTLENLSLTLGTDKRVSVKREKQQDYSSTRFLGGDVKQIFSYKLTVRNNQNMPVKMVLKDQYPISTLKEIEVEFLAKESTKPSFNVEDIGVITWEFKIQSGETKTFNFVYSIKYPKGKQLNL
ncbi:MAG: DUF4139 domain-containing protein [Prevotellaceae bacterium]|jgi:uncharacterized protein (TIGR02231 family)|nr:DUF4139 domain-containing protein [Prevotellaceae bacterium]